jgi:hypothetical protein
LLATCLIDLCTVIDSPELKYGKSSKERVHDLRRRNKHCALVGVQ